MRLFIIKHKTTVAEMPGGLGSAKYISRKLHTQSIVYLVK